MKPDPSPQENSFVKTTGFFHLFTAAAGILISLMMLTVVVRLVPVVGARAVFLQTCLYMMLSVHAGSACAAFFVYYFRGGYVKDNLPRNQ